MSKANGEHPTFDFSQVSYKWARQWSTVNNRMVQASTIMTADENPANTPEQQATLRQARLEAAAGFDDLLDERDRLMIQPLRSVPRDWLVADAPDDLGWGNVADLDYLRADKLNDLIAAIGDAQTSAEKK